MTGYNTEPVDTAGFAPPSDLERLSHRGPGESSCSETGFLGRQASRSTGLEPSPELAPPRSALQSPLHPIWSGMTRVRCRRARLSIQSVV
jgi:hypothetical protein